MGFKDRTFDVARWFAGFLEDQELSKRLGMWCPSSKRLSGLMGAIGGFVLLRRNLIDHGITQQWVDAFRVWVFACCGVYVFGRWVENRAGDKHAVDGTAKQAEPPPNHYRGNDT